MFSISSTSSASESQEAGSYRIAREVGALLFFASCVYVALALLSYRCSPSDPGVVGGDWVGPVGASLAGVLVRGFGVVAWLLPLELAFYARELLRGSALRANAFRIAGDLLVAILLAAMVHIVLPAACAFGQMPVSGNVGLLFGEILQALFSTAGSLLIGATLIALILIGRSSFSFIEFCQLMLQVLRSLGQHSGSLSRRVLAAWQEARALRKQRLLDRQAEQEPQISTPSRDAAIIAQLDDVGEEWTPIEQTGSPPLAVSQALRAGGLLRASLAGDTETPVHGVAVEDKPALVSPQAAPPSVAPAITATAVGPASAAAVVPPAVAPSAVAAVAPPGAPSASKSEPKAERAAAAKASAEAEPKIIDTRHHQEIKRGVVRNKGRGRGFVLPPTSLLQPAAAVVSGVDRERMVELAHRLEKTLTDYSVEGRVVEILPGPTVTTYEFLPAAGTKVSKVANLADDLALGLSRKVRIIAPIPGKGRIGFELPNDERTPVNLRELVEDKRFETLSEKAPLPVVLGRDIVGAPYYADLASMPHVIVAGATGAGKSVGLNVMLTSLLCRRTPDELRLLMIDPKVVELAPYDRIPHLLLPVVTDMKQAATALKWAVDEMERRYQAFANAGTKNITTYNNWVERIEKGELPPPKPEEVMAVGEDGAPVSVPPASAGQEGVNLPGKLPYIVIVVDEFADLMMQQGKEVEAAVARLAQKARAAGMHVVLATQRPSVDVITGIIKANFPTRIAFRVAQKVDSATILDEKGAELLLGRGDMLVKMNGSNDMRRVQCPFVSEEEVDLLTKHLRSQGEPVYHHDILKAADEEAEGDGADESSDPRFDEAVQIVADTQRCSTSWLQRKMTIGYNRAAKIVEMMEKKGMVGPPNGARDREIFLHTQ
ncbi:MAG TPA: DNA translocase FtsK 4TM domain-containing protein [Polyangiaceae bacterium]|nr:DNA translocase FtsK 4TM domain-containing protein [Polyangiaceae bacterium]